MQQVRRAAERGVDEHRVLDRLVGEHVAERPALRATGRAPPAAVRRRDVEPDRAAPTARAPRAGTVRPSASATTCAVAAVPRNWQPPPGRRARAAAQVGRVLERDETVREPRAERLHGAGVLADARRQRHAAGDDRARRARGTTRAPSSSPAAPCRRCRPRSRRGGRGRLRTSRRSTSAASLRYGERVEHPRRALAAPVAGVRDVRGEREGAEPVELRARPRGRAVRPPSGPCGSRARSACRRRRAHRPASRGSGTGRARPSTPPSPSPRSGTARRRRRTGSRGAAPA